MAAIPKARLSYLQQTATPSPTRPRLSLQIATATRGVTGPCDKLQHSVAERFPILRPRTSQVWPKPGMESRCTDFSFDTRW